MALSSLTCREFGITGRKRADFHADVPHARLKMVKVNGGCR
jgi:hypothetical protein